MGREQIASFLGNQNEIALLPRTKYRYSRIAELHTRTQVSLHTLLSSSTRIAGTADHALKRSPPVKLRVQASQAPRLQGPKGQSIGYLAAIETFSKHRDPPSLPV